MNRTDVIKYCFVASVVIKEIFMSEKTDIIKKRILKK